MEATIGLGKLRRICEILELEIAWETVHWLADSGSHAFMCRTHLGDVWFFPPENQIVFFLIDSMADVELRSAFYKNIEELELALPRAVISIEVVGMSMV